MLDTPGTLTALRAEQPQGLRLRAAGATCAVTSSVALSLGSEDTAGAAGTGEQQAPGPWDTPGDQPALCLLVLCRSTQWSGYLLDQMTGWNTSPGVRHLVQSSVTQLALGAPWLPGRPVLSPAWGGALAGDREQEGPKCSCCSSGHLPHALIPALQAGWDLKAKIGRASCRERV